MKSCSLACVVLILIFSNCSKKETTATNTESTTPELAASDSSSEPKTNDFNPAQLQGKWQSLEDETNYIIFDNNLRKEIAAGMDNWDEEEFVLAENCTNESDKSTDNPEPNRYISCAKSDMCWYIETLNEESLQLTYVGRGNTLSYKRVN